MSNRIPEGMTAIANEVESSPTSSGVASLVSSAGVKKAIDNERYRASAEEEKNADEIENVNSRVDEVIELIQDGTDRGNPLVNKQWVKDEILKNEYVYRGTFEKWTDVPEDVSKYEPDESGSTEPNRNDYIIVTDASGFSTVRSLVGTWRFIYIGVWNRDKVAGWHPEYQIDASPLTKEQKAAINSGITAEKVEQINSNTSSIQGNAQKIKSIEDNPFVVNGFYYDGKFYYDSEHVVQIAGREQVIFIDKPSNKEYRWDDLKKNYIELSANGSSNESYTSLGRIKPYLFKVIYASTDYEYGEKWFKDVYAESSTSITPTHSAEIRGLSVKKGHSVGHNYDAPYDDMAEFVIYTHASEGKHASIGMATGCELLTDSFVSTRAYHGAYKALPFYTVDGINDSSVVCTLNRIPSRPEGERTTGTRPGAEIQLCALQLPRYVLDNFSTASDAALFFRNNTANVYAVYNGSDSSEYSIVISDKTNSYLVEFVNNAPVVTPMTDIPSDDSYLPYVTNFKRQGATYTAQGEVNFESVEDYGNGLERFNYLALNYGGITSSDSMLSAIVATRYTGVYKKFTEEGEGSERYKLPIWKTDFSGNYGEGSYGSLKVTDDAINYATIFADKYSDYIGHSRDGKTRHTIHSAVYDMDSLSMKIVTQEGYVDNAITCQLDEWTFANVEELISKNSFPEMSSYKKEWNSTTPYQKGDIIYVIEAGSKRYFQSLINDNTGISPLSDSESWKDVSSYVRLFTSENQILSDTIDSKVEFAKRYDFSSVQSNELTVSSNMTYNVILSSYTDKLTINLPAVTVLKTSNFKIRVDGTQLSQTAEIVLKDVNGSIVIPECTGDESRSDQSNNDVVYKSVQMGEIAYLNISNFGNTWEMNKASVDAPDGICYWLDNVRANRQCYGVALELDEGETFTWDWGDGTIEKNLTQPPSPHTYSTAGDYIIRIKGKIKTLGASLRGDVWDDVYVDNLTKVTIRNVPTLTAFGTGCFVRDENLTSIDVPDTVTSFGEGCFSYTKIAVFYVPAVVTTLPASLFANCTNLKKVIFKSPNTVTSFGADCFYNCAQLTELTVPSSVTSFGESCFQGARALTSIIIPAGVTSIPSRCFYDCFGITSFPITDAITSFGESCFSGTGISSIYIPLTVTTLPAGVFNYCPNIKKFDLPAHITSVGANCFSSCFNLEEFNFMGPTTSVGGSLFAYDSRLSEITLPDGITELATANYDGFFQSCRALREVYIPSSVKSIGRSCFAGCQSLKHVYIGSDSQWNSIGANIFGTDNVLEEFYFPQYITTSGGALDGDANNTLKRTDIAGKISSWSWHEFGNLRAMTKFVLRRSDCASYSSGNYVFYNHNENLKIYVPRDAVSTYKNKAGWKQEVADIIYGFETVIKVVVTESSSHTIAFKSVTLKSGSSNAVINWGDGSEPETVDFTSAVSHTYSATGEFSITISDDVASFGDYCFENNDIISSYETVVENITLGKGCFKGCTAFTSIEFDRELTVIPDELFSGCTALSSIALPPYTTSIGKECFRGCVKLAGIEFPKYVQTIGEGCFYGCTLLQYITLPSKATSLPKECFAASGLVKMVIPNTITSLGDGCFKDCIVLSDVTLSSSMTSIPAECFKNDILIVDIDIPSTITSIGNKAFYGCGLTAFEAKSGLLSIGTESFGGCPSLASVSLSESVTAIGDKCFSGCSITTVELPATLTTLGTYIFENCTSLETVSIGSGITKIPEGLLSGCSSVNTVDIPASVIEYGASAFKGCSSILEFTIQETVATLGAECFSGCTSLRRINDNVSIPQTYSTDLLLNVPGDCIIFVKYSAYDAFIVADGWKDRKDYIKFTPGLLVKMVITESNFRLRPLVMANSSISESKKAVIYWGDGTTNEYTSPGTIFSDHTYASPGTYMFYLSSDEFSYAQAGYNKFAVSARWEGPISSDGWMFASDTALTDVYIGKDVTISGDSLFYGCTSLTSVVFEEGFSNLNSAKIFEGCTSLTSVTLPSSLATIKANCFANSPSLTSLTIPGSVKNIPATIIDQCVKLSELVLEEGIESIGNQAFYAPYSYNRALFTSVVIPSTVKTIGQNAFYGCANLTSVEFKSGLNSIGSYAFAYTGIGEAIIPNTVTSIGTYAFSNCASIKSVKVSSNMTDIPISMCASCSSLETLDFNNAPITTIGYQSFDGCGKLKEAVIPSTVTGIGYYAFRNCTSMTLIDFPSNLAILSQLICGYCSSLATIKERCTVPPSNRQDFFTGVPTTCNVYVPEASVEAYKATAPWSVFSATIQPLTD